MRIVIVGAGVIGLRVARALVEEGRDVVLIERDAEAARIAMNELDSLVIQDDGTSPRALADAGVSRAELFIALTGSDEANLVSCSIVAAQFPGPRRIARVRNPYYLGLAPESRAVMGVDELINPDAETADRILREIHEGVEPGLVLLPGELRMRALTISADSPFAGKTLEEARRASEEAFLVPALVREGAFRIPAGGDRVEVGDLLYVLAEEASLDRLLGTPQRPTFHRLVLVGGTRTTEFLIERVTGKWEREGLFSRLRDRLVGAAPPTLTLIEKDPERAKALARAHSSLLVLNLSVAEDSAEIEEVLGGADLVAALTDSQSLNLMTALRAKRLGATRTLALVRTEAYRRLAPSLEVDAVVNLEDAVVNSVLAITRRAKMRTLHSFIEEEAEILELRVAPESPAAGRRLKELALPKGALVLYVLGAKGAEIPDGESMLSPGENLCLIARRDLLHRLEKFFGGHDGG